MAKILDDLDDIRVWVEARGGYPLLREPIPGDPVGQPILQLSFGQHAINADNNEGPDRPNFGFELADWATWFEAFQAQDLVLVVDDDMSTGRQIDYRFMSRGEATISD